MTVRNTSARSARAPETCTQSSTLDLGLGSIVFRKNNGDYLRQELVAFFLDLMKSQPARNLNICTHLKSSSWV